MLQRWSAAATTPAPDPGSNAAIFGVPGTNTLKYNSLCRKFNDLASDACFNDETYRVVSTMIDEARKIVAAMRSALDDAQQNSVAHEQGLPPHQGEQQPTDTQQQHQDAQDDVPSSMLKNPSRVKPKGRPKEKSVRRKQLVEIRDEKNAKRRKKAQEGELHPTEKKTKKATTKRKPRAQKCPYCHEEGHTVQQCVLFQAMMSGNAAKIDLNL